MSLSAIVVACPADPGDTNLTFSSFTTTVGGGDGDGESGETGDGDGDAGDGDGGVNPDCGDGMVGEGEECDLGPENDDTGLCTTACRIAACGDGFIYAGFEECDDGNPSNTDDCINECKVATCGDGFVHRGVEMCDDANTGHMQAGVELCDDGNMASDDSCTHPFCEPAFCGDGIVWQGMEECDDANMDDDDGCPACDSMCMSECGGLVIVNDWNGWTYYEVPVMGTMTDPNIAQACQDCGLQVPCAGLNGCQYNDNICTQTSNETSCSNPMLMMSQMLCNTNPGGCAQLYGVYQYMGNNWSGGCGAEPNQWCATGNSQMNKFALCVN